MQQLAAELAGRGEEDLVDPDPDLETTDRSKRAYSHEAVQKMLANLEKRVTRRFLSEVKPALDYAQEGRESQKVAAIVAKANETAKTVMATAMQLPHFAANKDHILAELQAIDPAVRRDIGSPAALYMAYNKVLADRVFPTLAQTTEQSVLSGLKRAATASHGSVHPQHGSPGPAKPIKDGDVTGLARRMEELAAQMG